METKFAKVLDSGSRVVIDLKRKREGRYERYFTGPTPMVLPLQSNLNSSIHKRVKRRKLNGSKTNCGGCVSHFRKSLLKYYSNFKRSGLPRRIMCYQNGEWTDFPQDFVASVKKNLQLKKAATEGVFDGRPLVLDFLHMMQLDLETGLQQPIAWIDEAGNCFFPEIFSGCDELHECNHNEYVKDRRPLVSERYGSNDIKLQLEIEINGSDCPKLKECSGESNALVKQIQVNQKIDGIHGDADVDEAYGKNQQRDEFLVRTNHMHEDLDSDTVRKMFINGINSFMNANIVEIYSGSGTSVQTRLELFQKQVEITKKYRGDANVRYAWLPSFKGALSSVMMYGLGHCGTSKFKSTYGIGVHLTPANYTQISASYCDVDENGLRHMVLCRVIMGNMELVRCGSKQFHPSCQDFDSGVDDLQNPIRYIVWNMNMNTHIYPEYVVSFKSSFDFEGKHDISGFTTCRQGPQVQLQFDSAPANLT